MQDKESLFTGEQGVAYTPMPKGRGFTPRLVNILTEVYDSIKNTM